ncbi:MAG: glycoside hydrolase family 15 protein, partial [Pseudomonadota bacterium]|nr:glycoside hydrolase family 15 protein [Pseudomonadota bacterium]
EEKTLPGWEGYKGSKPVRIGNQAAQQRQLDIYGELIDSVYLATQYVEGISYDGWAALSNTINYVCGHWKEPDHGIWEFRGAPQHFLHSRLMCWVALDRALRLADHESVPPQTHWHEVRRRLYYSIYEDFWNEELQSFVQYKGAKTVDASALVMPLSRFIAPTDPKWLSTLDYIGKRLVTDALVQRYEISHIDFEGLDKSQEGSFTMCSFWYIECMARAGQVERARLLFEKMLGYANHLGLYAEELGMDGSHLGNFPQAFTHLALISAAWALDRKLSGKPMRNWRF